MGFSSPNSELASLGERLIRDKFPLEALVTFLKVVPVVITLREGNLNTSHILEIGIAKAFQQPPPG